MFHARRTFIGEVMTIPFERPRVGAATPQEFRVQIMEDPDYYKLHNYALDFPYNRFAHDDVG